jgi:hypothetical protein
MVFYKLSLALPKTMFMISFCLVKLSKRYLRDIHQTQEKLLATFQPLCQKVAYEVYSLLGQLQATIGDCQLSKERFVA